MANLGAVRDKDYIPPNIRAYAEANKLDPGQVKAALALGMITDPTIQAQYKDDPRTQLGLKAIDAGSDMSPLKGGIAEGLARVAQGFLGGRISRDQRALYTDKQRLQSRDMQAAIDKMNGNPAATVASALTAPSTDTAAGFTGGQPGATVNPIVAPSDGGQSVRGPNPTTTNAPVLKPRGHPAVALDGNNPGGLNDGNFAKRQPGYVGNNGRYAAFDTPQNGLRAQQTLLKSYVSRGYDTPLEIAKRWAPLEDGNNPGSYAQTIAKQLGISVNDKLNHSDIERFSLAQAHAENSHFGGSAASAPQAGSSISPVNTAAPPQVDIPDMPTPMAQPERPTLHKQIQSVRMQLVNNLLGGDLAKLDPTLNMLSVDKYLPGALTEEQDIRKQRDADEVDLAKSEYTSQLGRWSHQQDSAFDAGVKARETAQGLKNDYQKIGYQDQLGDANRQSEQTFTHNENEANRQNTLNVAAERGNKSPKMGEKARSDWRAIRTSRSDVDAMLNIVKDPKNEKHFGLQYKILGSVPFAGNKINQAVDPSGIKVRGVINNLRNTIVHARAGASQTGIELTQLDRFLPSDGDTAKELQDKIEGLKDFLDRANGVFENEYGKDAYRWTGGDVATPTIAATVAPPAPVVAPSGKFAPDAKGHRGTLKL